jgi:hypothetical protein
MLPKGVLDNLAFLLLEVRKLDSILETSVKVDLMGHFLQSLNIE